MIKFSRRTIAATTLAGVMLLAPGLASAATIEVTIQGFSFSPASVTAAVGDTIVFHNRDGAPHTATASDGSVDTGRINPGASGQFDIVNAGTIDYRCLFHPSMTGQISAQ